MTEGSRPLRACSGPSVTLPVGIVADLDLARRIRRSTTKRGTCYSEKLARLSSADRVRVVAMEAQLFAAGPRAGSCQPGTLPLPDSHFPCADGSIWFHYSATSRSFWLGCFELNDRGGRRDQGPVSRCSGGRARRFDRGWNDGIAVRLAQLLATDVTDRYDVDLVAWLAVGEPRQSVCVTIDGLQLLLGRPSPKGRLLIEIAAACRGLSSQAGFAVLPAWSLLVEVAEVQEQLRNPYARAIFAGEAFCRIGEAIGASQSNSVTATHRKSSRRASFTSLAYAPMLLWESAAILGRVRDVSFRTDLDHFDNYLTSPLIDEDMLGDVRRLALIRSEMSLRLTTTVFHQIQRMSYSKPDALHRYALLSDFVRLSATYFGCEDDFPRHEDVLDALDDCASKDRRSVQSVVGELEDFACSTTLIIDQLMHHNEREALSDIEDLHDRLLHIVTQLLAPAQFGV